MRSSSSLLGRIFWGSLRLEILEEIFYEMLLRKKYCGFAVYLQIKSLTIIFDENTQQYVALQEGFLGDRIGDARIFGVAKTEWERAFTMLSHDKNNLWCKS